MNGSLIINYILTYIQPLAGLLIGCGVLMFVAVINWYGEIKQKTVKWIAKTMFQGGLGSERSADGLFMVITSFLLAIGGIWVIVAILFLNG